LTASGTSKSLPLAGSRPVHFDPDRDIIFHLREALPFHANGIRFTAYAGEREVGSETYYSVGGGFVVQENQPPDAAQRVKLPLSHRSRGATARVLPGAAHHDPGDRAEE
jgi:hypothetical protein